MYCRNMVKQRFKYFYPGYTTIRHMYKAARNRDLTMLRRAKYKVILIDASTMQARSNKRLCETFKSQRKRCCDNSHACSYTKIIMKHLKNQTDEEKANYNMLNSFFSKLFNTAQTPLFNSEVSQLTTCNDLHIYHCGSYY